MKVTFYFSNETYDVDFITTTARITENFYNNLKSADNSAQIQVPFYESLSDKLKAAISERIKAVIYDDDNLPLFTGYVRNTISFTKTQKNEPITIEIISPAVLLDTDFNGNDCRFTNVTLASVVSFLLSCTDFEGSIDTTALGAKSLSIFSIVVGENIKEVLSELLFEYGYIYSFTSGGNFVIKSIFDSYNSVTQHFYGDNCLNEIQQQVKEDQYKKISVNWNKVEYKTNELIFEDTTNGNAANPANIQIDPNSYYLGEEKNYLKYDSKYQKILWIENASLDIAFGDSSGLVTHFSNLGIQGLLSIQNETQQSKFINRLRVVGTGYFETSTNQTQTGSNGKALELTAKYIQEESNAANLAKKLLDYYNYANFTTGVVSKTKYEVGTFCDVSDTGIGTVIYRIVKRTWNIKQNVYQYTLESVTDYDPTELYTNQNNVNSMGENGDAIRTSLSELEQRVSEIVVETTVIGADNLISVLNVDSNGYTIAAKDIPITIYLKQSNIDLDFSIGLISLPSGWSYSVIGKQVIFHVGEGVLIKTGQIQIPVQYKTVISESPYVDEDGNPYVDEDGNPYIEQVMSQTYTQWKLSFTYLTDKGGSFKGNVSAVSSIPLANYGDFFVWSGPDTDSDLVDTGKFLQGAVYKYVGTKLAYQWQRDTDPAHLNIALSNILGIANADLEHNNSDVWEYLDHLTSNSVFTDMIIANSAFIDSLTSKVITVSGVSDSINNIVSGVTGIDLKNAAINGTTLISGGLIKSSLIDVTDLLAKQIVVKANGILRSSNYNGIINPLGFIESYGSTGWAIDHNGNSDFVNLHATKALIEGEIKSPNFNPSSVTGGYRLYVDGYGASRAILSIAEIHEIKSNIPNTPVYFFNRGLSADYISTVSVKRFTTWSGLFAYLGVENGISTSSAVAVRGYIANKKVDYISIYLLSANKTQVYVYGYENGTYYVNLYTQDAGIYPPVSIDIML